MNYLKKQKRLQAELEERLTTYDEKKEELREKSKRKSTENR